MRFLTAVVFLLLSFSLFAQTPSAGPPPPRLNHFSVDEVDPALDACTDFYKYVCSKWQAANPIPADQAAWGSSSNLQIWNQTVLRDTLVQAAEPSPNRSAIEQ
ncbi:MAG: M13 family peptidase, partial [Terriglobales bacterium]